MKIPFFNYPFLYEQNKKDYLKIFNDVCTKGAYIMQSELSEFESMLADYTGSKFALGVANATDALQMGFMAGQIKQGSEVIFCSHTMVATASTIHFAGAKPVPVEAGADHLIDPKSIEAAITDSTTAIVPTQLNGRVSNMDAIIDLAKIHNLDIYEDSAQALGAKYKDKMAGTFGKASCISFYPAKILGSFGDAGAILTNDETMYEELKLLRDHGRSEITGDVEIWGLNSRLDNLQAAFLIYNFKNYDEIIIRRRYIASLYDDYLNILEELTLPPPPNNDGLHFDVFQNYEIEALNRDELQKYLLSKGVGTLQQWGGKAVHQFKKLGFNQSLPFTETLFDNMLMLPMNMSLSDQEVKYICESIKSFYIGLK